MKITNKNKKWRNANSDLHREDGSAIEWPNGDKEWYQNRERHRTDGPAVEYASGHKEWWQNGKRHREDGPAVEYSPGYKKWYWQGKSHRENGPAKNWFQNGIGREGPMAEYPNSPANIWFQNGKCHRENGPAVEYANGTKKYFNNGYCHRIDGPAVEYANGNQEWWFKGSFNRFRSEEHLYYALEKCPNIKEYIFKVLNDLDEGEKFLLRLTIKNHFPDYLDLLDF